LPDNQVVRSEQLSNELSAQRDENVSGVPGLAANILPDADKTKSTGATGAAGFRKEDNTRNYEIGKTISRQIMPIGQLQRLSVAVIVDGTYEKTVAGSGKDQEEQLKYIPRTVDEIQALENIVKRAVNYDEVRGDKVEVANIAFNTDEKEIMEPNATAGLMDQVKSHGNIIKYGVAALFVIFAFFFIIRPVTRWLTETSWEDVDLLEHLPNTVAELEKKYSEQGELTDYVGQVAQLISSNQEDSGRLLKQWLKET
jgi:flagellar M-ring protein FliF